MKRDTSGISWHSRVAQELIRQLYERDAQGIVDEELIDEVGFAFYARCTHILMVHAGQVQCPRCNHRFATEWPWPNRGGQDNEAQHICCPNCQDWDVTGQQYRESFQRAGLAAGNALPAFRTFVERYPGTTTPRARMLLIDQLIHEFHYGISRMSDGSLGYNPLPHASTGSNLIEGSHDQVVAFLDNLTYNGTSMPELEARQAEWRTKVEEMKRRRSPQH